MTWEYKDPDNTCQQGDGIFCFKCGKRNSECCGECYYPKVGEDEKEGG